ncbi:DeoR/GlpR family DNA-binding transcription regulator [Brachyspira intermedia]|uniref:DeoR/GlpR family DNA-binding transcription regulator n=1 Tax=Brachyspira intermedia TaxID=84377 RepID=UPI003004E168
MLRKERLDNIIKYLEIHKKTSIQELANEFNISPITIRLDIKELAKNGYCERSHGYVSISKNKFFLGGDINDRIVTDNELKMRLSKKASEYINPGDRIFLDDSSTVFNIIGFLINIPALTIITHSLSVMYAIRNYPHIHMIGLGGTFCNTDQAFIGESVINNLKDMHFNIAFMGCWSLNNEYGTTETSNNASNIKNIVSEVSDKNIIIASSDKFQNHTAIESVSWNRITKVVTDKTSDNIVNYKDKIVII